MDTIEIDAFFDNVLTFEKGWHPNLNHSFPFDPDLVAIARSLVHQISERFNIIRLHPADTDHYFLWFNARDHTPVLIDLIMLETGEWWFSTNDRGRLRVSLENMEEICSYLEGLLTAVDG